MQSWFRTNEICIGCLSANHAALRRKNKDFWLHIRIIYLCVAICLSADCCFSWASSMKTHLNVLVNYKADPIIISLKSNLTLSWYSLVIDELVLNSNNSCSLTHSIVVFYNKSYILLGVISKFPADNVSNLNLWLTVADCAPSVSMKNFYSTAIYCSTIYKSHMVTIGDIRTTDTY
jgi:hypothetical protein